jgi:peroxiredoxin
MPLSHGEVVPAFEALRCDGETIREITLNEISGQEGTVIVTFQFAFSAIADNWWGKYTRDGWANFDDVETVGLSRDQPYALNAFLRGIDTPFVMCSDPDGTATKELGVLGCRPDMGDIRPAKRATFVLDDDRTITYAWVSESQLDPTPTDEVEAAVERVRE